MGLTQKLGTIPLAISTDASNNVGIGGSPSGSYKLEVTGTAKVSSTLLVSGAATFSSSVTAGGELSTTSGLISISGGGGAPPTGGVGFRTVTGRLIVYGGTSDITFQKNSNSGPNLTILESGAATFTNTININNNTGGSGLYMTNTAAPNITGVGSATRGMIINGLSTSAAATGASFYFYGATNSYTSLTSGDLFQVTNNDAVKFRLDYAGAATFSSGISVGGATATTGGIQFPATAVAIADANNLDDYEEGTWTPVIAGGTTAGTGTYSQQIGKYTKVGRVVNIYFALAWTAHTGTGMTTVTGFPFANAGGGQNPFSVFTYGETMTAGNVPNGGIMSNGESRWLHWQIPTGGGLSSGIPIYNGSGEIQVSGTYIA